MIKEPHWKVHYRIRMLKIWSWIVQVTPKDLTIKYHTEGSACWIENVRLNRLKTGLNLDKIDKIESELNAIDTKNAGESDKVEYSKKSETGKLSNESSKLVEEMN